MRSTATLTVLLAAVDDARRAVWRHRTRVLSALICLAMITTAFLGVVQPPVPEGSSGSVQAAHIPTSDVCTAATGTHYYDVVAMQVDVVYNNWGDHDPDGRLFVLEENVDELQQQLEDNPDDPSPLVQPFVVRGHIGDCVQINLTNDLPEDVSIHVHGLVTQPGMGMDLGGNGPDVTPPGETRTYKMFIPAVQGMEGAHFLHSHASNRFQTRHGLFGAVVAEPPGTTWLAPDGTERAWGQAAIIQDPSGADFREYLVIYHDEIQVVDDEDDELPTVSPYGEYGPGTKGMNLRSEPFLNRFELHDELNGEGVLPREHDKSQGYGSYTYGDPSTFFMEAYVGDATKMRLMNAGPGQHHVHHLHGGGIRWRTSPVSDDTQFDDGFVKVNPVNRSKSERIDVQSMGPGESFNAEIEGGAGGVQQTVGDLLIHCHVVEHYIAGMWMFWRVYNTEQDHLAELPDRDDSSVQAAVDSVELFQKYQTEGELPNGDLPTEENFRAWVEAQLPPQGVPEVNDAAEWNWAVDDTLQGPRYLGEPETEHTWPNYPADAEGRLPAGERPVLEFDPTNGRLAFPHLRPHLGKRPPFAPNHGGTPYLGPDVTEDRPDGLCPQDSDHRRYNLAAIGTPVEYNEDNVDDEGLIYVRAERKEEIKADPSKAKSLAIRANQYDCVDTFLTSELPQDQQKKVNIHIHLVQFDIQASDGVIVGFNYEQSVRSAETTGTGLDQDADPGDDRVKVVDDTDLEVGTMIGIGLTEENMEVRRIVDKNGAWLVLDEPLDKSHATGERVGHEFVHYRWYPDVELGMVYWHDHVAGLTSWRHGLFGGLVVEPDDSQWCDPKRPDSARTDCGDELDGHVKDIVSSDTPSDESRTYREYVVQVQDRSAPDDFASFNLKAEPLDDRSNSDNPLDSGQNGDPVTDRWEAYPGDETVVRLLYAGQSTSRAVASFGITGHRFPREQHNPGSRLRDTLSLGISSQHNLRLDCGAGSCYNQTGDYLYYLTQPDNFRRGAWGIFRVHEPGTSDLQELPSNPTPQEGTVPTGPVRSYDLTALRDDVVFNERETISDNVQMFVRSSKVDAIQDDEHEPEPAVLRANVGDTIEVTLTNDAGEPVTIHPGFLQYDPETDGGIAVGDNPLDQVQLEDGETDTFRWYADEPGVGWIGSFGNPDDSALKGLYGAVVVEPEGATFDNDFGPKAEVTLADGTTVQEQVLLYQTDDPDMMASVMPYRHVPEEVTLVNYRTEPWEDRLSDNIDEETPTDPHVMNSSRFGAPETPTVEVQQGQPLRIIALGGGGDQLQVHHVAGHVWPRDPGMPGCEATDLSDCDSNLVDFATLGQRETSDAWIPSAGEGGAGEYYYGTHRAPFMQIGGWGLVRVT